jgi:acyl-CoA thioesterase-1
LLLAVGLGACARKTVVPAGTIIFLGDSITAGYGLDPSMAYPALIHIPGMTTRNLGVSGSQTQDGLQRLRDYFATGATPQLVVIALGANDFLHAVPASDTEQNLAAAVGECQSRHIPVLLCGIRLPMKFGTDAIFSKVASDAHVPLLPDLMDGEFAQDNLLQDDGHPSEAGQRLIAEKMEAALLQHFTFGRP